LFVYSITANSKGNWGIEEYFISFSALKKILIIWESLSVSSWEI